MGVLRAASGRVLPLLAAVLAVVVAVALPASLPAAAAGAASGPQAPPTGMPRVQAVPPGTLVTSHGRVAQEPETAGLLPQLRQVDATAATNWSGEIERGTTFSAVSAEWTVPTAIPGATPDNGYSSTWVGVGGATADGSDEGVVQTGTAQNFKKGVADYYAWYEVVPTEPAIPFMNATVEPGDHITASVAEESADEWHISIEDVTRGWTMTKTVNYPRTTTSAEWIEEAPILSNGSTLTLAPLADYGSVQFTQLASTGADPATERTTAVFMLTARTQTPNQVKVISYPKAASGAPDTDFTVTYGTPVPTVTSVTPAQDAPAGGVKVTVHGTWLLLVRTVRFGNVTATITPTGFALSENGTTSVRVIAPAGTTGTVDVTAVSNDGTTATGTADSFTYEAPPPSGYDLVGADGGVFVFPPPGVTTGYYGSLPTLKITPASPIVGMVPSTGDQGYFLVGRDGGVFSFGNAPFFGSLPGLKVVPTAPIVGIVATAGDKGYFLVGRDGGVFAFGDAPFLGSLPGMGVSLDDIVGIASTPTGNGYWLVSATGQIYAFGTAQRFGTATIERVAAIAGTPTGGGYWLAATTGAVGAYGTATDFGTLPHDSVVPALPVVGIVRTAATGGYWLIGQDGGIFAFGDAGFTGSLPGDGVHVADVVAAVPIN